MAGNAAGLQRWHHCRSADGRGGRILVHPGDEDRCLLGLFAGVCVIASGLTFLETVANPYTTVLGPPQYAATRINLAQSCNGIGWFFGPIAGGMFFYSKNAAGQNTGSQTLWIPYAGVAVVVIILAVLFFFADVPDIKTEDVYHLEEKDGAPDVTTNVKSDANRVLLYSLLVGNATVLIGIFGMILWVILSSCGVGPGLVGIASRIPHPPDFCGHRR